MSENKKIKVLIHSNYSRMVTGFGKNMKNVLLSLFNDPDIEVIEASNGVYYGSDKRTPWKSCGTAPIDQSIINQINADPSKTQAAGYGFYTIDKIIEDNDIDVYLGIEDIWAFREFEKKPWWNKIPKIIWTTIDSVPILPEARFFSDNTDKFLVWASFAEEELRKIGHKNVETLHGAVDYSNFKPLENRLEIRNKFSITDEFVIGFVFKNQLRKSVPNILEGFRIFKEKNPQAKAKLLLHTDWSDRANGWDILRFIDEKKMDVNDFLASYVCHKCGNYFIYKYIGEEKDCPACGCSKSVYTKTSAIGVSEEQLNEIYNCMDVYCHPFTSGGQELPIQEAKAAGLITLVTSYSCGTDSCYEHQGGIPLDWSEYREPNTQFVKATTCPDSIANNLQRVFKMEQSEKKAILDNGQKYIKEKFCVEKIVNRLKEIIIEAKTNFIPKQNIEENKQQILSFEDLLDKDDSEKRIAVVIPQSENDVYLVNGLLENIKKTYPQDNIYFITKPEYFDLVEDNPYIHKLIPYQDGVDNSFLLEGRSNHKGYFKIAFLPHSTTQKFLSYLHNGKDIIQFELE
jgi:glycosyltransferase involved in cell wall biosynthesis